MKDRYFLDTNILVYCFDKQNKAKQDIARSLVKQALQSGEGIISFQVIQEFCNIASKQFKIPITNDNLILYTEEILSPLCTIWPSVPLYQKALTLQNSTKYSFYDALIIASALEGNRKILYSEDLYHTHKIETLKIINPF